MSQTGLVLELIRNQHVFSNDALDSLRDYRKAREVVGARRKRFLLARCLAIKEILNAYRVTVRIEEDYVLVYRTSEPSNFLRL